MGALIWDSSTQAFKDAETPLVNGAGGVWTDSVGKVWDSGSQAWFDAWPTITEYEPSPYYDYVNNNVQITLPITTDNYATGHINHRVRTSNFDGNKIHKIGAWYSNHTGASGVVPCIFLYSASGNHLTSAGASSPDASYFEIEFTYNTMLFALVMFDGDGYGGGTVNRIVVYSK